MMSFLSCLWPWAGSSIQKAKLLNPPLSLWRIIFNLALSGSLSRRPTTTVYRFPELVDPTDPVDPEVDSLSLLSHSRSSTANMAAGPWYVFSSSSQTLPTPQLLWICGGRSILVVHSPSGSETLPSLRTHSNLSHRVTGVFFFQWKTFSRGPGA